MLWAIYITLRLIIFLFNFNVQNSKQLNISNYILWIDSVSCIFVEHLHSLLINEKKNRNCYTMLNIINLITVLSFYSDKEWFYINYTLDIIIYRELDFPLISLCDIDSGTGNINQCDVRGKYQSVWCHMTLIPINAITSVLKVSDIYYH